MSQLDKLYGTGHPHQEPVDIDASGTAEKQNKYYSSYDHEGTLRKKLIDLYPDAQH